MPEDSPMLDWHRDRPRKDPVLDDAGGEVDELRRRLANAHVCIAKLANLVPVYADGTTHYLHGESIEFLRPTADNGTRIFFREVEIDKPIEEVAKLLQAAATPGGA